MTFTANFAQESNQQEVTQVYKKKRKEYDRKNVVKLNVLSLPLKTLNVSYERLLFPKVSFQLGLAAIDFLYKDSSESATDPLPTKYKGFQIQPEVRFYVSERKAPGGFYFAPFFRYRKLEIENQYTTSGYVTDADGYLVQVDEKHAADWISIGGGIAFGYQLLIAKERLALGAFFGSAYYAQKYKYKNGANYHSFPSDEAGNLSYRLGITVGYSF